MTERVRTLLPGDLDDAVPYLQAMLGTVDGEIRQQSPETLQLRVLDALRRLVLALVERGPFVIAIEDLHWADASTLSALRQLLPEGRDSSLLFVLTTRGDRGADVALTGAAAERAEVIHLEPLADDRVDELVVSLLEGGEIPGELLGRVVETAGGNPFYPVGADPLARRIRRPRPRRDHMGRDRRRERRAADDDREGDPGSARRAPGATARRAHRRVGARSRGRPAPAPASGRIRSPRRDGRAGARRPVRTRWSARRGVVLARADPGGRVRVAAEAPAARAPRDRRRGDRGAVAGADRRVPRSPRAPSPRRRRPGGGATMARPRRRTGRTPARGRRGRRAPHGVDRALGRAREDGGRP